MESRKLAFTGSQSHTLDARLDLPEQGSPRAYALFAHCFTCSKNLKAVVNINRALTDRGIAVLRFDFTGLGESEGDFSETNFSSDIADLVAATEYLVREFAAPKILIGHSLGGAAVLQAASRIPSAQAVATIGAPFDPQHVASMFDVHRETIETEGAAQVTLAGRTFKITKQFLDDLEQEGFEEKIQDLRKALLVFHSPIDNTVGIDNAARIFQTAKHPKSFVSLDTADHLLSREEDSRYVGAMIAQWATRYI